MIRFIMAALVFGFAGCCWFFREDALRLAWFFAVPMAALLPQLFSSRVRYERAGDTLSVTSPNGETVSKSIWDIEDVRVIGASPDDRKHGWYVIVADKNGGTTVVTRTAMFDRAVADARRIRDLVAESRTILATHAYRGPH